MAQGTEHIVGGVAVWLVAAYCLRPYIYSFQVLSVFLLCAIAGSLFPDIDVKSKGQKFFYSIMAPGYIFLFAQGQYALCFVVGLCALMPILSTHRGLFHRWWFLISFASLWGLAIVRMFPQYIELTSMATVFFILGSLSHLWLDFGLSKMFVK
jgi:Predicted membrane-bound metal-dependent hydrolase (DUF457).